ncbi:MAG: hypothetical protein WCJ49_05305, partial [Deltaproteobacteria bacterium]
MENTPKVTKTRSLPTVLADPKDLKSLIPPRVAAVIQLPSRGVFYAPSDTANGFVEIMPLCARDEKLLAGMTGNNIDEI